MTKIILPFALAPMLLSLHAQSLPVRNVKQFTAAVAAAQPGDTITLRNGMWDNAALLFAADGAVDKNIVLRAETPGGVLLTGNSTLQISGKYLTVDGLTFKDGGISHGDVISFRGKKGTESSYCRLTNTSVIDYNPADRKVNTKWISLHGDHNRVDHCYFAGKTNLGTTLVVWVSDKPNYHVIDSNYFGPRPELGENGGESIRVGTGIVSMQNSHTLVADNLFESCNGEVEIISNKTCENVYRHNTFVNCKGTLTLRNGNHCTVTGNFFFGNHLKNTGGIRITGEDHLIYNNYIAGLAGQGMRSGITIIGGTPASSTRHYNQVKRVNMAHNTLVDNASTLNIDAAADDSGRLPAVDCIIANNIFSGSKGPLVLFQNEPGDVKWNGNIFYGAETGFKTLPEGNEITDPEFTKADAFGVMHLSAKSPAINRAALDYPYISIDMDGQPRAHKYDIGADEYSDGPVFLRPVTRADVGPKQ